ncbi:hypothetical protein COTS27_00249 [Spirochaetota bacterium]|nr:hypothetical protein COTS27_00249 [Spirochaetota bacterium]
MKQTLLIIKNTIKLLLVSSVFLGSAFIYGEELVIGEETVSPGIVYIFEGAVKDQITPTNLHLAEANTHIHIEARVNWHEDENKIPEGTPGGGFVPYLKITAKIVNRSTKISTFVDLVPHINLIDNFHYARNITLPGKISDNYSVEFNIIPPPLPTLALHKDWVRKYGKKVTTAQKFSYKNVNFEKIAKASRK